MHPGVIIGILVGLLFGGINGALIGGLLTYVVIYKIQSAIKLGQHEQSKIDPKLLEVLFLSLGKVAKSDGIVRDQHIECARYEIKYLELDVKSAKTAMLNFNRGKSATNFAEALVPFADKKDVARWLLCACWRMAWSDGIVGIREKQTLVQLGAILNIKVAEVLAWGKEYQPDFGCQPNYTNASFSEALQLLGVTAEDSYAHVKKAYRKLLSKNHPDKLAGSGAVDAEIKKATEFTRKLHNAYKLICIKQNWN